MTDTYQDLLHAIETNNSDDVIEHFGIKGMKWGFRRSLSKLPQSKKRAARRESKAARKAWNMKYHKRHSMTERDLQAATRRLRMENDFAEQVRRANQIADTRKPKNEHGKFAKAFGKSVMNSVVDSGVKTLTNDLMRRTSDDYTPFTNRVLSEGRKLAEEHQGAINKVRGIWGF